ncbi:MAG: hypothetical protein QOK37_259 [Thermoanaerobaculia bacterium]|jgi:Holliday junction resolvase-like predicted endonuclease|nr:hypothetical protein [Thermoanaerobaculia bacterium]
MVAEALSRKRRYSSVVSAIDEKADRRMASTSADVSARSPKGSWPSGFDFIVVVQQIVTAEGVPDLFQVDTWNTHQVLSVRQIAKPAAGFIPDGLDAYCTASTGYPSCAA